MRWRRQKVLGQSLENNVVEEASPSGHGDRWQMIKLVQNTYSCYLDLRSIND
jgi:hypothetical protein